MVRICENHGRYEHIQDEALSIYLTKPFTMSLASPVADKFGRRWGAAIGITIIIIGSVIQSLPMVNEAMFLAGRFMVGCG